ncbi:hypothetical protein LDENG_00133330 [Lucifuga dentata]|nr:hypothetical protein LDENG_00133330 [Lucifuga dentata]
MSHCCSCHFSFVRKCSSTVKKRSGDRSDAVLSTRLQNQCIIPLYSAIFSAGEHDQRE